jgi:hypothetical protein
MVELQLASDRVLCVVVLIKTFQILEGKLVTCHSICPRGTCCAFGSSILGMHSLECIPIKMHSR